jgi:hypothetical protein
MCCIQRCMKAVPLVRRLERTVLFMRAKQIIVLLASIFFLVSLGPVLVVAGHNGYWSLLPLVLCMSAAIVILYVSHARAEYLWLGALGGVALIVTPLTPALTVTGSLLPDVIGVAVFVVYYKFCVAGNRMPAHAGGGHGSGYRPR